MVARVIARPQRARQSPPREQHQFLPVVTSSSAPRLSCPHPTRVPWARRLTFPLPEAQLDRFALRAALGYPALEEEIAIVAAQRHAHPLEALGSAISLDDLRLLQQATEDVYVDDLILTWIVSLVRATRQVEGVANGASVRGSLALERIARARALLHGRPYVVVEDVEKLFLPVIGHRLMLTTSFYAETRTLGREAALELVRGRCLALAPAPEPDWDRAHPDPAAAPSG